MSLRSKSSQLTREDKDGVRICIMRRPEESVDWDIWIPHLAPSHEVLTARHQGTMSKSDFDAWITTHVLKEKREYLEMIIEMAYKRTVTLLCFELDPITCHRYLVMNECQRLAPDLDIKIG